MILDFNLTDEERRAIASLNRLAKKWPKTLWIFANGSSHLSVLRTDESGERAINGYGAVDQSYIVGYAAIPNDGGDW